MDTKTTNISKIGIVVAVLALVCVAGVSDAYSYSSSVTSSGNTISADYLTINTYKNTYGETDQVLDALVFDKAATDEDYAAGKAELTPGSTISVRISSNATSSAYVYGYYTCASTFAGVAVKSIELLCNVYDSNGTVTGTRTMVLYKDSFNSCQFGTTVNLNSATSAGETTYYYDMVVTKVTINYYPGIVFTGGNVDAQSGTSHEQISLAEATNPCDFDYHFLASRDSLLQAS